MPPKAQFDRDPLAATGRLLTGLIDGEDIFEVSADIAVLHPPNDTFPGEVFIALAAGAMEAADVGRDTPLQHEGLVENYLPECEFKGRQHHKINYAIFAGASVRGGLQPDLLDEVSWWRTDDFWHDAMLAAIALIRASAGRQGTTPADLAQQLAKIHNITTD